jgi:hypothetical protein
MDSPWKDSPKKTETAAPRLSQSDLAGHDCFAGPAAFGKMTPQPGQDSVYTTRVTMSMIVPKPFAPARVTLGRVGLFGVALLLMLFGRAATAQDEKKEPPKDEARYGFAYSPILYAQKTPKEAITSIVKAIDTKRVDYLLAHLADPKYVDAQVAEYRPQFPKFKDEARTVLAFDRLVRETVDYYFSDPALVRELRVFARDGAFDVNEDAAVGVAKDLPARKMFFKRIGDRWFLENRQQ